MLVSSTQQWCEHGSTIHAMTCTMRMHACMRMCRIAYVRTYVHVHVAHVRCACTAHACIMCRVRTHARTHVCCTCHVRHAHACENGSKRAPNLKIFSAGCAGRDFWCNDKVLKNLLGESRKPSTSPMLARNPYIPHFGDVCRKSPTTT